MFAECDLGAVLYYEGWACVGGCEAGGAFAVEGEDVGVLTLVECVVKRCEFWGSGLVCSRRPHIPDTYLLLLKMDP